MVGVICGIALIVELNVVEVDEGANLSMDCSIGSGGGEVGREVGCLRCMGEDVEGKADSNLPCEGP